MKHDRPHVGAEPSAPTSDCSSRAALEPEPVELEISDVLDLHYFRPKEIGDLVKDYLELAWQKGIRRVRLIHGKGMGVQRRRVHALLERHPKVIGWGNMPEQAGGWGATWVEMSEPDKP